MTVWDWNKKTISGRQPADGRVLGNVKVINRVTRTEILGVLWCNDKTGEVCIGITIDSGWLARHNLVNVIRDEANLTVTGIVPQGISVVLREGEQRILASNWEEPRADIKGDLAKIEAAAKADREAMEKFWRSLWCNSRAAFLWTLILGVVNLLGILVVLWLLMR